MKKNKEKKKLSIEEKKELKRQIKERTKKIEKLNKSSKIVLFVILGIALINIIFLILSFYNNSFSIFYTKYIINNITGILFNISSRIPYFSYIYILVALILILVLLVYNVVIINNKKDSIKSLNIKYNKMIKVQIILYLMIFYPYYISLENLSLPLIDELMFEDTINKTYEVDDLNNYLDYTFNKIEYYSSILPRDDENKVIFNGDYNKQVVNDLKNVEDKLTLLGGVYPKKSNDLTDVLKRIYGNDTIGLTHMYNIYVDFEIDSIMILSTMTHEYCHSKSLTRENETVFCSYLAGINSKEDVSKYGAYLEGFTRALEAYKCIDIEKALVYEDKITSLCKSKDYYEICNIKIRQSDYYLSNSYEIFIDTYSLKNYKENKSELLEALSKLKNNDYKLISTMTKKELSIDDISKLIDNESYDVVMISGKIDEERFNNIKDVIDNDSLFMSVYQKNYEYEISDKQKNEPVKFFLEPIEKDYKTISNSKVLKEFTYERVTRLLLEYHDKYGY
ncbi:MAG: DUF3810 family protein [bacterium]|nr:DUF3810 family protein [bacterium]